MKTTNNLQIFIKGFRSGMMQFGNTITIIVNSALLLLVYIFGVGITSIIAKIFGKKFLDIEIDNKKKSYWTDLNIKKKKLQEYYKQY